MTAVLGLANRWKETMFIAGKYLTSKLTFTARHQQDLYIHFIQLKIRKFQ
jgi:hypothetical protein